MIYIALLRGINVGGNNKVSMQELKLVLEQAGMKNVKTYINSGNVLFESELMGTTKIAALLEKVIEAKFGFNVKVLVWDKYSLAALEDALPKTWVNDTVMRCDILFLWETIDSPLIVDQLTLKPGIDNVKYEKGALLWSVERKNATKSGMLKIIGTDIYKQMTIRNCNTLRKLVTLSDAMVEK
jgi:uncharacterized protein (DUF1697 family)